MKAYKSLLFLVNLKLKNMIYLFMYMCMNVWVYTMWIGVWGVPFLVVSSLVWMLGTELQSFGKTGSTLNHLPIFPAPQRIFNTDSSAMCRSWQGRHYGWWGLSCSGCWRHFPWMWRSSLVIYNQLIKRHVCTTMWEIYDYYQITM